MNSTYSSSLTNESSIYNRLNADEDEYYYESIEINVDTNGLYEITGISSIYLYGYLYNQTFDPLNSSLNLITFDSDPNLSFSSELYSNLVYQLVISTVNPNETGSFEIIVSGPGQTRFSSITLTTTAGYYFF